MRERDRRRARQYTGCPLPTRLLMIRAKKSLLCVSLARWTWERTRRPFAPHSWSNFPIFRLFTVISLSVETGVPSPGKKGFPAFVKKQTVTLSLQRKTSFSELPRDLQSAPWNSRYLVEAHSRSLFPFAPRSSPGPFSEPDRRRAEKGSPNRELWRQNKGVPSQCPLVQRKRAGWGKRQPRPGTEKSGFLQLQGGGYFMGFLPHKIHSYKQRLPPSARPEVMQCPQTPPPPPIKKKREGGASFNPFASHKSSHSLSSQPLPIPAPIP